MKNADLPAMPQESIIEVKNGMGYGTKKVSYTGLTKREMFALHAMQGLLSSASNSDGEWTNDGAKNVAKEAVYFADALLAELEK